MFGLESVDLSALAVAALVILPGFISMRVYSLLRPGNQPTLKDTVFEALAYGLINLGLMFWAIVLFFRTENIFVQSALIAVVFAIAPIAWPFLLDGALNKLAKRGLLPNRNKTAWDEFFSRRQECWLIVHFDDGSKIAGRYSDKSYATIFPTPGHLYIEELWDVDQQTGTIAGENPVSDGIILKPEDYRFIEIKQIVN